ncbi:MAG: peptidylprolyl isomerase [Pseudomonadota bacterium]
MTDRNRGLVPLAATLTLVLGGLGWLLAQDVISLARAGDAVVARVNGAVLDRATFDVLLETRARDLQAEGVLDSASHLSPQQRQQALDDMITMELLVQEARRRGLDQQARVAAEARLATGSWLARQMVQEYTRSIQVDPVEILERYRELTPRREYRVSHILLNSRAQAQKIARQLRAGQDFTALADAESEDVMAGPGGDLGWLMLHQMLASFADAVRTLQPGSVTAEPVASEFGWHIIRLENQRELPPPTFEEVQLTLKDEIVQARLQRWMARLRIDADVELNSTAWLADAQ